MNQPLKIYFFGSIWGAEANRNIVSEILRHLKTKGKVLSEHLFTEEYKSASHLDVAAIHNRDISWVNESDVMVGDVTAPSLGVGYELREGVVRAKPILCLYRPEKSKNLSAMIDGSPGITVKRWNTIEEATDSIDNFFRSLTP